MLVAKMLMALHSTTLLPSCFGAFLLCFLHLPSHWSITPSWRLSEMEESSLAIETHIDLLARSPHPNLLTPSRK